jgi:hypothetical protein
MAGNVENSVLAVPAELEGAGQQVRQISGNLFQELQTLRNNLAPLEATWTGATYDNFHSYELAWDTCARALWGDGSNSGPNEGLLPFIAHALDMLWANYESAESANTKTWTAN